ncbi:hypothetical protein D3C79_957380 [compost metagenome]
MMVRSSRPSSRSRMAIEYTSSPVLQPATQILIDGHVRSSGTTSLRSARKWLGSRNISLTGIVRNCSNCMNMPGSCSTRSCRADTVRQSNWRRAWRIRRLIEAPE